MFPEFKYIRFSHWNNKIIWYDIGSNSGNYHESVWYNIELQQVESLSYRSDCPYGGFGDPEHAILSFEFDQNDSVDTISLIRMPSKYDRIEFDREMWGLKIWNRKWGI